MDNKTAVELLALSVRLAHRSVEQQKYSDLVDTIAARDPEVALAIQAQIGFTSDVVVAITDTISALLKDMPDVSGSLPSDVAAKLDELGQRGDAGGGSVGG